MTLLPDDVLNIIFTMHWETIFYDVILELKQINNFYKEIYEYDYKYTYQSKDKYNKINELNKKLIFFIKNKGNKIYLKSLDKSFSFINNNIFKNEDIGIIYSFFCSKSDYMRYYVLNDYNKMLEFY